MGTDEVTRRGFFGLTGLSGGAVAAGVLGGATTGQPAAAARAQAQTAGAAEPDIELAKLWWPVTRGVGTPIGWKNHLFRFTSFYNGSLIGAPKPPLNSTPGTRPYDGKGLQLDFAAWDGWFDKDVYPDLYPGHFYVYPQDIGRPSPCR